jgi:hypothetical protein
MKSSILKAKEVGSFKCCYYDVHYDVLLALISVTSMKFWSGDKNDLFRIVRQNQHSEARVHRLKLIRLLIHSEA